VTCTQVRSWRQRGNVRPDLFTTAEFKNFFSAAIQHLPGIRSLNFRNRMLHRNQEETCKTLLLGHSSRLSSPVFTQLGTIHGPEPISPACECSSAAPARVAFISRLAFQQHPPPVRPARFIGTCAAGDAGPAVRFTFKGRQPVGEPAFSNFRRRRFRHATHSASSAGQRSLVSVTYRITATHRASWTHCFVTFP
jgi:hypothetical protein